MHFNIQFQFRVFKDSLKSSKKSKMKAIASLALLFVVSEAVQQIPYEEYVRLGGVALPEYLRAKYQKMYTVEDAYNNSRIVGGEEAAAGEGPFTTALLRSNSINCGGAIYNERTIITASHCLDGY